MLLQVDFETPASVRGHGAEHVLGSQFAAQLFAGESHFRDPMYRVVSRIASYAMCVKAAFQAIQPAANPGLHGAERFLHLPRKFPVRKTVEESQRNAFLLLAG